MICSSQNSVLASRVLIVVVLAFWGGTPFAQAQLPTTPSNSFSGNTSATGPSGNLSSSSVSTGDGVIAEPPRPDLEKTGNELPGILSVPEKITSREGLSSAIQIMLLLTVISIAPAILLMTTCFVRVIVVLGLLRQALGTQQLPPSQVITSISLFITLLLMTPVWKQVYDDGIRPYQNNEISLEEAFQHGSAPLRRFMANQIVRTENDADVMLFMQYIPAEPNENGEEPNYVYYDAQEGETLVPLQALLPAFMLSELKTAFLIGFQVYLPFVILDIVVATVTISMGMLMLPPVLISLPFKILLFVLVDGWRLVVGMLMESFVMF